MTAIRPQTPLATRRFSTKVQAADDIATTDFSNHATKSFNNADFCGESFAKKGELLKNVWPLVFSMKLFGLYFYREGRKRRRPDDVEWNSSTTSPTSSTILRVYATVFLIIMWLNAFRFLTVLTSSDYIGAILFVKIALISFFFLISIIQTAYYFASHRGKLLKVLVTLPLTPDCIQGARRVAIGLTAFMWITIIGNEVSLGCFYFLLEGEYDFTLSPLVTYIKVPEEMITVARCAGFLITVFFLPSQFFAQTMNILLVYVFHHQFKKLKKNFSRALDEHGQFTGDLSSFRRRHQELSSAVSKVDEFMMLSNVGGFICHIVNIILMLYGIVFYPAESMATPFYALIYTFWLFGNTLGLLYAASGGIIVNYMAHKLYEKVFDIDLSTMNDKTVGEVNVFLNRLNGQPIGFSVLGIFVIDKNTIITILGVLVTYFLLVVQFATPSTGHTCTSVTNVTNVK